MDAVESDEKTGRWREFPLSRAKVSKADVMAFWKRQPFDLDLGPGEGNCDLCFATGRNVRLARIRRRPGCAHWWAHHEAEIGGTFDRRDSVSKLMAEAAHSPELPLDMVDEFDAECGLHCGVDS